MKHENHGNCPRCDKMMEDAHPDISYWFHRAREFFPTLHTSSVWRGKDEQNALVLEKKSLLKWPNSKHNHTSTDGKPCSLAMDLFSLTDKGAAEFRVGFYVQVSNWLEDQDAPIRWGGNFKTFVDPPHFELKKDVGSGLQS